MNKQETLEKIDKIISKIEMERKNLGNSKLDEGFDCGTQLALDLLEEWKDEV